MLITEYKLPEEEQKANIDISLSITGETIEREVKVVPTIFFNGQRRPLTFPVKKEEVRSIVEEEIAKLK